MEYLNNYVDNYNLRPFIKFNTLVFSVRLYENLSEEEKKQETQFLNKHEIKKFLIKTIPNNLLKNN